MQRGRKKKIVFITGFTGLMDYGEYTAMRELISHGYVVEQARTGIFGVGKKDRSVMVPSEILSSLSECAVEYEGNYGCNGKVVLDIGGFVGDSVIFFALLGAAKIIVYEPVAANCASIGKIAALNGINCEIHEEGIDTEDGYRIVRYTCPKDSSFFQLNSLADSGNCEMRIKLRNVTDVILESGADMAKFDCEGGESSLLHVPNDSLGKIEFYIIEAHTQQLAEALIDKFKGAGFSLTKKYRPQHEANRQTLVLFFKKP